MDMIFHIIELVTLLLVGLVFMRIRSAYKVEFSGTGSELTTSAPFDLETNVKRDSNVELMTAPSYSVDTEKLEPAIEESVTNKEQPISNRASNPNPSNAALKDYIGDFF